MKHWALIIGFGMTLAVCPAAPPEPAAFDPNNAAHWYRKAFALYEEPNDIDLDAYIAGEIEFTPKIEQFCKSQKPVIDLIRKASKIEHCNWEHNLLANGAYTPPPYLTDATDISKLIFANIRLNEKNNYHLKINNNFRTILVFASHVDQEMYLDHLIALSIRARSYDSLLKYLNRHPNCRIRNLKNIEALLKVESNRVKITFKETINGEIKFVTRILTDYKTYIYEDTYLTKLWGIPVEKLSPDFYRRNLKYYKEHMATRQSHLDSPYPQAVHNILEQHENLNQTFRDYFKDFFIEHKHLLNKKLDSLNLNSSFLADADIDDIERCDCLYTVISTTNFVNFLSIEPRTETQLNALKVGIDLLIKFRESYRIPDKLSPNYPKDLFSDKPFLIIKTVDGFKLKCQGVDLGKKNKIHEYEFKLPTK